MTEPLLVTREQTAERLGVQVVRCSTRPQMNTPEIQLITEYQPPLDIRGINAKLRLAGHP
jgi:hypothetical protein